ncbi:hypothetical protein OTC26_028190 [Streptomyces tirandamycinicus]|uniref:hypothetical protein n=1 Tax=Streptomyces tirandamycinicus TaxID=2174846 RepID=UPI00227005EC|nr:hypothetical protein [Streptomyces tirandamycinicus]MCY0979795.1 hypothetical protein [Streptomyces tirandamycinicus]
MLALLHTSPVHVPVFDALRDRHHPGLRLRHTVDEELLAGAGAYGPRTVADAVRAALAGAVAGGAAAVLCTCSTIGAVAERCAADVGVPVLRVDRPMAAAAAAHRRIVVVATVASTVAPTVALIGEELRRGERGRGGQGGPGRVAGRVEACREPELRESGRSAGPRPQPDRGATVRAGRAWGVRGPADGAEGADRAEPDGSGRVRAHLVEGAWERFESGDLDGYLDAVAAAVDAVREADVIVLAQASMADAAARATTPVPVLSSPRPGLAAAARAVAAGTTAHPCR